MTIETNNKNKLKKALSLILTITLIVTIIFSFNTNSALASIDTNKYEKFIAENDIESLDKISEAGLKEAFEILETAGIHIIDNSVNNEKVVVSTTIDGKQTTITITEALENGNIEFDIVEGSKNNTITMTDVGTIYMDGELVQIEEYYTYDEGNKREIIDIDKSLVYADAQARYLTCPYGNGEDYTYYVKTRNTNATLVDNIAEATITAICLIITSRLAPYLLEEAAISIATKIVQYAGSDSGKTVYVAARIYYNKNKKSFMVTNSIGCQKELTSFSDNKAVLIDKKIWLYSHVNGA